jgi:hypothetical protein
LGRSTQTLQPVWVARPKACSRFGSLDPNIAAGLGERPKPCSWFGSLDPNFAAGLVRPTQTLQRFWVDSPKPRGKMGLGRPDPTLTMVMGLGRPTQTFRNLRNQTQKKQKNKTKKNYQSCPHRPYVLTHRVCAGLYMRRKKIKKKEK